MSRPPQWLSTEVEQGCRKGAWAQSCCCPRNMVLRPMGGHGSHLCTGISETVTALWVTLVSHEKNHQPSSLCSWNRVYCLAGEMFHVGSPLQGSSWPFFLQKSSDIHSLTHGAAKRHHEGCQLPISHTPSSPSPGHHKELR